MSSTPIAGQLPSSRSTVHLEQANLMALLIGEFIDAAKVRPEALRDLPEYRRLLQGAADCGFECRDYPADPRLFQRLVNHPALLEHASFHEVRRFLHHLTRSERQAGSVAASQAGALELALSSGALAIMAQRLLRDPAWRPG